MDEFLSIIATGLFVRLLVVTFLLSKLGGKTTSIVHPILILVTATPLVLGDIRDFYGSGTLTMVPFLLGLWVVDIALFFKKKGKEKE